MDNFRDEVEGEKIIDGTVSLPTLHYDKGSGWLC
jgi:hypothetical protein